MTDYVFWPGLEGRQYQFELYPVGSVFHPISGVYIICQSLGGGRYGALYVGESKSLYQRLSSRPEDHDGYVRALRAGATHICAMRGSEAERLRIETELRHSLRPPCNAQPVPTSAAYSLFDLRRL